MNHFKIFLISGFIYKSWLKLKNQISKDTIETTGESVSHNDKDTAERSEDKEAEGKTVHTAEQRSKARDEHTMVELEREEKEDEVKRESIKPASENEMSNRKRKNTKQDTNKRQKLGTFLAIFCFALFRKLKNLDNWGPTPTEFVSPHSHALG
jgi:hypothetical protein